MWFVYILQSTVTGRLYTGITTDPARRLREHNGGKRGAKATRAGRPWQMAYTEELTTKSEALRREVTIKRLRRRDKILLCAGSG